MVTVLGMLTVKGMVTILGDNPMDGDNIIDTLLKYVRQTGRRTNLGIGRHAPSKIQTTKKLDRTLYTIIV